MCLRLSNLDIQICVYLLVDSRRRVDMIINKHCRTVEILQHTKQTSSVPIICHTAAIINLPCSVFKHLASWRTKRVNRQMNMLKLTHYNCEHNFCWFLLKGLIFCKLVPQVAKVIRNF